MGTSPYMPLPLQVAGDHPHAYGDKFRKFYNQTPSTGSSPRVWGQDIWQFSINGTVRIIPTRMGTSTAKDLFNASSRDHPHACGDKMQEKRYTDKWRGSSPRVWGQEISTGSTFEYVGIIPTRVGTSPYMPLPLQVAEDHPHACGDKQLRTFYILKRLGSSPRVWGQERI